MQYLLFWTPVGIIVDVAYKYNVVNVHIALMNSKKLPDTQKLGRLNHEK